MSDTITERLAEIAGYARHPNLTEGPWWSDSSDMCWRLHGVMGRIPPQLGGAIPEQIMNKQILKAAKQGTTQAEYWPEPADGDFIVKARMDLPLLLAALELALKPHEAQTTANGVKVCPRCSAVAGAAVHAPCPEVEAIAAALSQDTEETR